MCRGAKPLLGEDIYRLRDTSPQRSASNVASGPVPPDSDSYNLGKKKHRLFVCFYYSAREKILVGLFDRGECSLY